MRRRKTVATTIRLTLAALLAILISMLISGFLLNKSRRLALIVMIVLAAILFGSVLAIDYFAGR